MFNIKLSKKKKEGEDEKEEETLPSMFADFCGINTMADVKLLL